MATVSFTQSLRQYVLLVLIEFPPKIRCYQVINHMEYYESFFNYEDSDLVQELDDYVRFRKYSSPATDLLITAIANALWCKILLLQEKER